MDSMDKSKVIMVLAGIARGRLTVNEAAAKLGLPRFANCDSYDKKLAPAPEPLVKPEVYVCEPGFNVEIIFLAGDFADTTISYRSRANGKPFDETAFNALLGAYLPEKDLYDVKVAYDPWCSADTREAIAEHAPYEVTQRELATLRKPESL